MKMKAGMSWKDLQKQEAKALTAILQPDESGKTQVQEDPSRPMREEIEKKTAGFKERIKAIRSKVMARCECKDECTCTPKAQE